jgi:hypothetical protein
MRLNKPTKKQLTLMHKEMMQVVGLSEKIENFEKNQKNKNNV